MNKPKVPLRIGFAGKQTILSSVFRFHYTAYTAIMGSSASVLEAHCHRQLAKDATETVKAPRLPRRPKLQRMESVYRSPPRTPPRSRSTDIVRVSSSLILFESEEDRQALAYTTSMGNNSDSDCSGCIRRSSISSSVTSSID